MGRAALSAAAQNGFSEIVAMLIARSDVDINHKGYYGQTPLLIPSYMGRHSNDLKLTPYGFV
jgi:ankyrin repeat protein